MASSPPTPYLHPAGHQLSKHVVVYSDAWELAVVAEVLLAEALGASDGRGPALARICGAGAERLVAALDREPIQRPTTVELRADLQLVYERATALMGPSSGS